MARQATASTRTVTRCFLSLYCPELSPAERIAGLVQWCDHYSPLVMQDGPDGIMMDIAGCSHLFGGEARLLGSLQRRLQRMGIKVHAAIADTRGAAWALARYGATEFIVHGKDATESALHSLPVEALRLPTEMIQRLRSLGLTEIATVSRIPRSSLLARFGGELLLRLDQAFHRIDEPLMPWRPVVTYRAVRAIAEPISTTVAVGHILHDLLRELCERLEKDHLGARSMNFSCYRVDGSVDQCEVRTSTPTRSIARLIRLFDERLGRFRAEFGFESFVLSVLQTESLVLTQMNLTESEPGVDEDSLDALLDRLGMRLGFAEVNRIAIRESYLPEHAVELCPVVSTQDTGSAVWPEYRLRPIRMIDPPIEIQAPEAGPVTWFTIGRNRHTVVRSEGPERLEPEWWRTFDAAAVARDYYRVEDEHGFRFWIYWNRDSRRWFLQGHFG